MEYFSYEELKALKVKVIKQHGISKYEENCHEKSVSDTFECEAYFLVLETGAQGCCFFFFNTGLQSAPLGTRMWVLRQLHKKKTEKQNN